MSFQQVVNLKKKMEEEMKKKIISQNNSINKNQQSRQKTQNDGFSVEVDAKSEEIDKMYDDKEEKISRQEFQIIKRPVLKKQNVFLPKYRKYFIYVFLAAAVAGGFYFYKNHRPNAQSANNQPVVEKWYAVKLTSGDIFYGKIKDVSADPVVLTSVYYDYDQMNKAPAGQEEDILPKKENENLRLVKRGKEAYGPDGTLNIVRVQIVYMEPLSDDSKVLKAITENEK